MANPNFPQKNPAKVPPPSAQIPPPAPAPRQTPPPAMLTDDPPTPETTGDPAADAALAGAQVGTAQIASPDAVKTAIETGKPLSEIPEVAAQADELQKRVHVRPAKTQYGKRDPAEIARLAKTNAVPAFKAAPGTSTAEPTMVTVTPRKTIARTRIGKHFFSFTRGKKCLVPVDVMRHLAERGIIVEGAFD